MTDPIAVIAVAIPIGVIAAVWLLLERSARKKGAKRRR